MNQVFKHTIEISKSRNEKNLQEIENYDARHIINKDIKFRLQGRKVNFSIVFSTSSGVFILDTRKNLCKQILSGKFYGIIKHNDFYFFARLSTNGERDFPINNRVSEICYSKISNYSIEKLKIALFGIPAELHQIESLNGNLIFPHTGYNQILSVPFVDIFNSNKALQIENCSSIELILNEFSHLNSISYNNENLFVIAHNYTMKTGRLSDLIIYNIKTKKQELVHLEAHSAHNIFIDNQDKIFCDSNNKRLMRNKEVIFEANKLLRGLSITEKNIFVGGSDICFNDYKRFSTNPSIYVLDKQCNLQAEFIFDGIGDIYEIRQFEDEELSIIQN